MRLRRCAVVVIEPRERLELDLASLFRGDSAVSPRRRWFALAPHLDREVELDEREVLALGQIGEVSWQAPDDVMRVCAEVVIASLLEKGLLIGDKLEQAGTRARDELIRSSNWNALSAVAHVFGRWSGSDVGDDVRVPRDRMLADLVAEYGLPPSHRIERVVPDSRMRLPSSRPSALHDLMRQRATCRNFDPNATLDLPRFGDIMQRVFGCHAVTELLPGIHALKKSNPSGGSMHPLEAYLLVRRVEGFAPGLYHYHVIDHALEPLGSLEPAVEADLAARFVGGQHYLANAPVQIALVARFGRTFWKYRNHAKAYRTIVLEAGHVSQNLYLAATEAGLGAFITAAINEVDIERAFGLDPLIESPLAVCGFGTRSTTQDTIEFDPLEAVWDSRGQRSSTD